MLPSDQIHKELSKTCLHGKNVYNKYTGQMMYQSCGKWLLLQYKYKTFIVNTKNKCIK
jgi:hypothetical protein